MGAACQHAASARDTIELADIFRADGGAYAQTHRLGPMQWKVVRAIVQCRTAALGGHREAWVVYSKRPFAGPQKLLDYLGRYTHRVAISNHRLLSLENGQVKFAYRDRRDGDRKKTKQLPIEEFTGRFLKHVLPGRFMRIRHYGFLGNRAKKKALAQCRQLLGTTAPEPAEPKNLADWLLLWTGEDISRCPQCGHPGLVREEIPRPRFRIPYAARFDDFW